MCFVMNLFKSYPTFFLALSLFSSGWVLQPLQSKFRNSKGYFAVCVHLVRPPGIIFIFLITETVNPFFAHSRCANLEGHVQIIHSYLFKCKMVQLHKKVNFERDSVKCFPSRRIYFTIRNTFWVYFRMNCRAENVHKNTQNIWDKCFKVDEDKIFQRDFINW